jgi:hypothetical protein
MYTKKNTRVTFRSNRRSNYKRNSFTNNKPRNKGNITQQYNKYLKLAKEASSSGDRIQSEYYYQFTDHYYRLMLELGLTLEENELQGEKPTEETLSENNATNTNSLDLKKNQVIEEDSELNNIDKDSEIESIESVPFISEPIRKKVTKTKKASA